MNGPQTTQDEIHELTTQMQELGASAAEIKKVAQSHATDDHFEVCPENWPVIKWFAEVQDLFVFCNGWCRGLDVMAVEADARLSERQFAQSDYTGLRLLAKHITDERNERLSKK